MIPGGQCSDALRALGRFLEELRASEIIIVDQPDVLEASWRGRRGTREERKYRSWELDALRTWAKMFRGLGEEPPRYTLQEALRTLGREVDLMKLDGITIVQTSDGWWVSGNIEGTEVRQNYTNADLMSKSQRFHAQRTTEEAKQTR
jgi:hypothetical protein